MTFRDKAKAFVRGDIVENAPESIRLFSMCEAMKWSHLPVSGGIYDQHPQLLKEWAVIWDERAKYEKKKAQDDRNAPKKRRAK